MAVKFKPVAKPVSRETPMPKKKTPARDGLAKVAKTMKFIGG